MKRFKHKGNEVYEVNTNRKIKTFVFLCVLRVK